MKVVEKYPLSQADREFMAQQLAASKRRKLQALKATLVAVPVAIVAAGIPGAAAFWWSIDEKFAAVAALPGLALAAHLFRRLHPDFKR